MKNGSIMMIILSVKNCEDPGQHRHRLQNVTSTKVRFCCAFNEIWKASWGVFWVAESNTAERYQEHRFESYLNQKRLITAQKKM